MEHSTSTSADQSGAVYEAIYDVYDEDNYFGKQIVEVATRAAGVSGAYEFFEDTA